MMENALNALDREKALRWDGHSRPHYEVWYTTLNQLNSGAGFWIRYAILAPRIGNPTTQIWFTSFVPSISNANVAAAVRYSIDRFASTAEPFSIQLASCNLHAGRMAGMLDAGGVPVTWDLVYEPVTDPLLFLPEIFYKSSWVRSKLVTPHPFMQIGGKIQIQDSQFIFNGDPGQQGHVWGSRHADEWVWFHCSSFIDEAGNPIPGYVTGITAQQRLLGKMNLRPLSFGHLVWNEKHLPIRPTTPWLNRWLGPWEWKGSLEADDVTVTLKLPWHEMVLADYDDPAGHRVFCHYTGRSDCVVTFRTPRQPPRVFNSTGMAHLEIGSRNIDPRVTRKVMQF